MSWNREDVLRIDALEAENAKLRAALTDIHSLLDTIDFYDMAAQFRANQLNPEYIAIEMTDFGRLWTAIIEAQPDDAGAGR